MENSDNEDDGGNLDNLEDLDEEQMDKLIQLQGLTGLDDLGVCRALLESQGWDLEAVAREHLGITEPAGPHPTPPLEEEPPLAARAPPAPARRGGEVWQRPRDAMGWLLYILSLPARVFSGGLGAVWAFVTSLFGLPPRPTSQVRDPVGDVANFLEEYERSYGANHPPFHRGSYAQALEVAKRELRFLLVYLHSEDHQDTDQFCTEVMANQEVVDYLSQSMLVWACSVRRPEGYRVSQALRESTYPCLAMIVLRQNRMVVVGRQEGFIQAEPMLAWLRQTVTDYEAFIVAARAERDERNLDREIRNEQEQAFQETLRRDQEREQRIAEEDLRRQEEAAEEERKRQEEERARKAELDRVAMIQQQKIELASEIPDEPEASDPMAVRVLIKLPGGQRLERRFLMSHSLKHIYYFVFCHPDSPNEFEIVSNYPKRRLACKPTEESPEPITLEEAGFSKSEMLFVNDLES